MIDKKDLYALISKEDKIKGLLGAYELLQSMEMGIFSDGSMYDTGWKSKRECMVIRRHSYLMRTYIMRMINDIRFNGVGKNETL